MLLSTRCFPGAVALTIGIAVGYLYFIIFNYAYQVESLIKKICVTNNFRHTYGQIKIVFVQDCDKLVDAIYPSELWLDAIYNLLMSGFSVISLIYILQRRYYGAIDSNLDKVLSIQF